MVDTLLLCESVVAYMSHVEVFATGIKIELRDQSPLRANHRIKVTQLQKSKHQERAAPIWTLTCKKLSDQELQAHFLPIKNLDLGRKCFNKWHISDYPLFV